MTDGLEDEHVCAGLLAFNESADGCKPTVQEGHIAGCDATHHTPITFCPFCGERLPEHEPCFDCRG